MKVCLHAMLTPPKVRGEAGLSLPILEAALGLIGDVTALVIIESEIV